jgi:hypothetical protein
MSITQDLWQAKAKILYPEQVSMNKRKLGGIRLIPGKSALSVFYLSSVIYGAENQLCAGAGSPEPSNLLSDERVLRANRTSSPTSIPSRRRWS